MINQEQVMGFIRHALTVAGGIMITKGITDEGTMIQVIGASMTLIGFAWSYWAKRHLNDSSPVVIPSANTTE